MSTDQTRTFEVPNEMRDTVLRSPNSSSRWWMAVRSAVVRLAV